MNLLKNKLIFEYDLSNIIIFSLTAKSDINYRPLFKLYVSEKEKPLIYNKVDFKMIEELITKQEEINMEKMVALNKEDCNDIK